MHPITPPALQPGATIALISPSLRLNQQLPDVISRGTSLLEKQGYKVREIFTLDTDDTDVHALIKIRHDEIRQAFTDPAITAIICTIGGSTMTELLPALLADKDLQETIRKDPKLVIGYSDITCLHWWLYATTGLRTFYAPCIIPELGNTGPVEGPTSPVAFCLDHLMKAITQTTPLGEFPRSSHYAPLASEFFKIPASTNAQDLVPNPGWQWLRGGKARGRLFGGCLTVVVRIGGIQPIVPDWHGRIVFLETALSDHDKGGNPLFRVRAAFADLIAQGVFDDAAGLVVGRAFGYDSEEARAEYTGVIKSLFCGGRMAGKPFPILFGVDFGHTTPNVTLPYDAMAELDSEADSFRVSEAAVKNWKK